MSQVGTDLDVIHRGLRCDTLCVLYVEAQELTSQQNAALLPTMSARPNPQLWFTGTPPDDPCAWCYGLRIDGEVGAPRMAHFDWGADLDLTAEERQAFVARDARRINELGGYLHLVMSVPGIAGR